MGGEEIRHVVERLLRQWLTPSGFKSFILEDGEDHDGDPALFINVLFDAERSIDATALLGITGDMRDELYKRGDRRLPYIRMKISDAHHEAAE